VYVSFKLRGFIFFFISKEGRKGGLPGFSNFSLWKNPYKLSTVTHPAKLSLTFFIIWNIWEPVSQKSPFFFSLSIIILMYGNNSGAYCIVNGVYVLKNSAGSVFATALTRGSSKET
jgi:hypothetical protein